MANFRQPPSSSAGANIISKNITANGTYNASSDSADGYNPVTVNVPGPTIVSKNITANGTYNASSDSADGYNPVTVNVPSQILTPEYAGLSYLYVANDGAIWTGSDNPYYVNIWNVTPGKYALIMGDTLGNRNRVAYKSSITYADISSLVINPSAEYEEYVASDLYNINDSDVQIRTIFNIVSDGVIVYGTSNNSAIVPAYCIRLS